MSQMGVIRYRLGVRPTSAFPLIATKLRTSLEVGFVPEPDSCTAVNDALTVTMIYSITSSARARSDSAIISPIAFAVFRFAGEQRQTPG